MNIYNKTHVHNAVFCEQLQSVIDGKPKTVQYGRYAADEWSYLDKEKTGITLASWNEHQLYRIKPPEPLMVTRTVIYPAPMTVALGTLNVWYFVCLPEGVDTYRWNCDLTDNKWLAAGVCHLTREAAQAQLDAYYGVAK